MSRPAGEPPTPHRHGHRLVPARWSLRNRLLALLLVMLTAVSAAIVGISVLVLRSYLVDQVDVRLAMAHNRWNGDQPPRVAVSSPSADPLGQAGGYGGYGGYSPQLGAPETLAPIEPSRGSGTLSDFVQRGQAPGTIAGLISNGQVNAVLLGAAGTVTSLPTAVSGRLAVLPVDRAPRTVSLDELGAYRLTASRLPDGAVAITGLSLRDVDATVNQLVIVAGCVAGAGVIALGVVGAFTIRRTLRPLRRVAATAARVAELPLDRGEVMLPVRVPAAYTDPRTEVGQVGAALNHMLGHVGAALAARHASETRVRQFVADASHELRTPLAAIRGYAELTRRMVDEVPVDVAHAMGRVESETARMTTLVEDLLLLARLDSGRPLEDEEVDLSLLVLDVVSDAHVAAPEHRFALELSAEPVSVRGDQARLHQVLANLLANARAHTPPGTHVTVRLDLAAGSRSGSGSGVGTGGGEVVLSVIDDGPGIPPALLPDIFERFARGDTSRSREAGSTGLGLAIVAAVVEAHDGRIEVSSAPGRTCFTVRLPIGEPAGGAVGDSVDELSTGGCTAVDLAFGPAAFGPAAFGPAVSGPAVSGWASADPAPAAPAASDLVSSVQPPPGVDEPSGSQAQHRSPIRFRKPAKAG